MKKLLITAIACGLFATATLSAQDMPEMPPMPTPTAEHQWLQNLVGTWESESEIYMVPDAPPMKVRAVETFRSAGPFWVVGSIESAVPEMPFSGAYTLGFDIDANQFVGFWVDSMKTSPTHVRGKQDSDDSLVMEFEGPCPMRHGQLTQFREVTKFINNDHRVMTTSILDENGEWIVSVRSTAKRVGASARPSATEEK